MTSCGHKAEQLVNHPSPSVAALSVHIKINIGAVVRPANVNINIAIDIRVNQCGPGRAGLNCAYVYNQKVASDTNVYSSKSGSTAPAISVPQSNTPSAPPVSQPQAIENIQRVLPVDPQIMQYTPIVQYNRYAGYNFDSYSTGSQPSDYELPQEAARQEQPASQQQSQPAQSQSSNQQPQPPVTQSTGSKLSAAGNFSSAVNSILLDGNAQSGALINPLAIFTLLSAMLVLTLA